MVEILSGLDRDSWRAIRGRYADTLARKPRLLDIVSRECEKFCVEHLLVSRDQLCRNEENGKSGTVFRRRNDDSRCDPPDGTVSGRKP